MGVYQRLLPEFVLILLGLYLLASNVLPQPQSAAASGAADSSGATLPFTEGRSASKEYTRDQKAVESERAIPLILKSKDEFVLGGVAVHGREELVKNLRVVIAHGMRVDVEGGNELKREFYPWFAGVVQRLRNEPPVVESGASGAGE